MKQIYTLFVVLLLQIHLVSGQGIFSWGYDAPAFPLPSTNTIFTTGHTYNNVDPLLSGSVIVSPFEVGSALVWQTSSGANNYPRPVGSNSLSNQCGPNSDPDRLAFGIDFNSNVQADAYVKFTVTFPAPVCGLNFNLHEIDKGTLGTGVNAMLYSHIDEVVISAKNYAGTDISLTNIDVTPSAFAQVSSSGVNTVITGTSSDGTGSGGAKTLVTYPSSVCVKTLTITYRIGVGSVRPNPLQQLISIGCLKWNTTAMPVILSSLTGKQELNNLVVNWATTTEVNSESFDIQRSNDLKSFENIGQIKASGNTVDKKTYSFLDKNPTEGINYYRLKQNDFDGSYFYSKIIPIEYTRGDVYYRFQTITNEDIIVETNAIEPNFGLYLLHGIPVIKSIEQINNRTYRLKTQPTNNNLLVFRMKTQGKVFGEKFFVN
jgi:hypothetical protein